MFRRAAPCSLYKIPLPTWKLAFRCGESVTIGPRVNFSRTIHRMKDFIHCDCIRSTNKCRTERKKDLYETSLKVINVEPILAWMCHFLYVMVIVLAIWPMVCGFKLGRERRFLTAMKIRSMTSFGDEVKPSATCRKILRHVKNPWDMREVLIGKIQQSFLAHFLSTSLQGASAAIEWRMYRECL
jgi:hypothetical protein